MYYDNPNVHPSALKHGVTAEDAIVATTQYIHKFELEGRVQKRELRLGFDSAGRLLETIVVEFEDADPLIVHAMKARTKYLDLLPRGGQS